MRLVHVRASWVLATATIVVTTSVATVVVVVVGVVVTSPTAIRGSIVVSVVGVVVLIILHLCIVAGGYSLHLVAVAVVAGDDDAGVLQLVLQVGVGSEDDASAGNQTGLHLVYVLHRL